MKMALFGFILAMWILIIVGGGILVLVLGPMSVTGYGEMSWLFSSILKAVIAVSLVVIWTLILLNLKNWIFRKEINS